MQVNGMGCVVRSCVCKSEVHTAKIAESTWAQPALQHEQAQNLNPKDKQQQTWSDAYQIWQKHKSCAVLWNHFCILSFTFYIMDTQYFLW